MDVAFVADVAVQEAPCLFKASLGALSCPLEYPGIFHPAIRFSARSIPDGGTLVSPPFSLVLPLWSATDSWRLLAAPGGWAARGTWSLFIWLGCVS